MQTNVKVTIVRPTKITFDPANPHAYGKFMVSTCTMNNSLSHLTGGYFVVSEDDALQFQDDIHEAIPCQNKKRKPQIKLNEWLRAMG